MSEPKRDLEESNINTKSEIPRTTWGRFKTLPQLTTLAGVSRSASSLNSSSMSLSVGNLAKIRFLIDSKKLFISFRY